MATCRDVFGFLSQVRDRHVTSTLAPADLGQLRELQIVQVLSPEEYAQIGAAANAVLADRDDLAARIAQERALAAEVATEDRKTHSILFHLEGKEKQAAALRSEAEHRASLEATDRDLAERQQKFDAEIAQRSLLDTLVPFPGGYVALTGFGARELRDLGLRLYRVSDLDFAAYWAQRQAVARELNDLADRGAQYVAGLLGPLGGVDRSALWAVSVGLAKLEPEVARGTAVYVDAYDRIGGISHNPENRLLSAEILTCLPRGVAESLPALAALDREVRQAGVPRESSLGVASMLLLGQRADGTFATTNLSEFLHYTRSYEAAALLAIVNRADVGAKFASLRSVFASWGYQPSEDVELASAFLAVSELPVEGVTTKLAILARGLGAYLQYPLVSAAIVASVPVLEANEALNLVEEAYEIVGRRAMPATSAELICLAVRMVHGVRAETIRGLDTTATAPPAAAGVGAFAGPRFFFVPVIVAHGVYYSTFGGIGGAHPGHIHVGGGGFTG